jgi:hypothetical protein
MTKSDVDQLEEAAFEPRDHPRWLAGFQTVGESALKVPVRHPDSLGSV